jgi:hypothetical protein
VTLDHRVVHLTARQHLGERVADQFADTELPLGWTGRLIAMVVTGHVQSGIASVMPAVVAGIHAFRKN